MRKAIVVVSFLFSVLSTQSSVLFAQIVNPSWPLCSENYAGSAGLIVNVSVTIFDAALPDPPPDPSLEHATVVHIENGNATFVGEIDPQDFGTPNTFTFSAPGGSGQVFVSMLGENFVPFAREKNPDGSNIVHDCSDLTVTVNGHSAWVKALAASAEKPLEIWGALTAAFGAGSVGSAIGAVGILAGMMGADPADCTPGIEQPDFSGVPAVDTTLVGHARLESATVHNAGMIVALGNAAITAQNRSSCPTRSAHGVANQFAAAQRFTNRMGNRLLVLQNQMQQFNFYFARHGMDQADLDTLNSTFQTAGQWGSSLASGVTD